MNRWRCPNCYFYNEYSADRCASCNRPRPGDLPAQPTQPDTPPRKAPNSELKPISIPRPAPVAEPKEAPRPATAPEPRQVPASTPRKRTGRSAIRFVMLGIVALIGVIVAVGAVASQTTDDGLDSSYIDAFWEVNATRNDVVDIANSRYDQWLETNTALPGPEYLVVTELSGLQAEAELMGLPESDELLELHQDWLASLQALAAAELLLAQEPTQANLDANLDAWSEEDFAYTPLYDTCSDR